MPALLPACQAADNLPSRGYNARTPNMFDPVTIAGTWCLQLLFDVVRQIAFALPAAYAWEFEKNTLWREADNTAALPLAILVTGLAAGSISVLIWPSEGIVAYPFAALIALASAPLSAVLLSKTRTVFHEIGAQPPSMLAVRDAMIFALGIALTRAAML
jgi:hypothetical protein